LLKQRAADGHVRRCHGDLHLGNIVLLEGQPTLFDAIEFDELLATIDILYDLAFLLMDLWMRGHKPHANIVLNHYLVRAGEKDNIAGLAALPLFLSCRAAIRAMVTLDRLPHIADAEVEKTLTELKAYFDLARQFLEPDPPRLIAVGGLSGTGKSTLAGALAPYFGAAPGALWLRSDVERKLMFNVGIKERLSEVAYKPKVNQRIYETLNETAKAALTAGQSVILDAVFSRETERRAALQVAQESEVPFTGLWLRAPAEKMIERVELREGDASDADAAVVKRQLEYDTGDIDWHIVDAGSSPDNVLRSASKIANVDPDGI
jgi:predicted kinase